MTMTASERLKKAAKDPGLLQELGGSGLEQYNGLIHEEFLAKLSGRMGQLAFREMELNDPIVGAMLYSLEMLMRSVNWTIEPAEEDNAEAVKHAEFIEEVFGDMEHDWAGFIGEWMAAPVYGFAPFEIIWKSRKGYDPNPGKRSKFTDGKIGVSRLAVRHPVTLYRWLIDEEDGGRVIGMEQSHLTTRAVIPAEKLLLFTVLQRKGNPEGTSLLRRCFIPYYRKKKIEEVEGIGIERELNGLPVMHVPSEWFLTTASAEEQALLAYAKKVVKRIKVDEQNGLVLPMFLDDNGNPLLKFELMSAGGRRAIDTGPVKEYYSRQMAMSILMDVIMVGHEKVGSFALASSKTSLMGISIGALLDSIETVINRDLIPRIMALNGLPPEMSPRLKHGDIETPDLEVLGTYINNLTAAGLQLFPSETGELERVCLRAANLPDDMADNAPERFAEAEEQRAAMAEASALAAEQGQGQAPGAGKDEGKKEDEKPFGKYDPNQPRDEDGQWSETGADDDWEDDEEEEEEGWSTAHVGEEDDPGSSPNVNWTQRDLQDSGKVTEASIARDYGRKGGPAPRVYRAYVPISDIPSPDISGEEGSDAWMEDYQGMGRSTFPPIKLEVNEDGEIGILDGNHRLTAWDGNYEYAPAWVLDYRPGPETEKRRPSLREQLKKLLRRS